MSITELEETPEQKARDMLDRMGIEGAQFFTAGEIVELANLIAAYREAVAALRLVESRPRSHEAYRVAVQTLAKLFHETYEALAPSYGYETRPETRVFNPESPNGRLMIAVCEDILNVLNAKGCKSHGANVKTHLHDEQFDGHPHPYCGKGTIAVTQQVFEATPSNKRCKVCERYWFPNGQPDWHFEQALAATEQTK